MVDPATELRGILAEACGFLDRPDADTGWNRTSIEDARVQLHDHLRRIEAGDFRDAFGLRVLFAPTGFLQEAAMASGWRDRYMELADNFDRVIEVFDPR